MSENLEIQMSLIAMKLNDSFTCRRLDLMMNNRDCKNLTRLFLFPKLFSTVFSKLSNWMLSVFVLSFYGCYNETWCGILKKRWVKKWKAYELPEVEQVEYRQTSTWKCHLKSQPPHLFWFEMFSPAFHFGFAIVLFGKIYGILLPIPKCHCNFFEFTV